MSQSDQSKTTVHQARLDNTIHVQEHGPQTSIVIVEPDSVQEMLIDGIVSASLVNGIPRIVVYAERPAYNSDELRRVIVARLAMTVDTARLFVTNLSSILNALEELQKGVDAAKESAA